MVKSVHSFLAAMLVAVAASIMFLFVFPLVACSDDSGSSPAVVQDDVPISYGKVAIILPLDSGSKYRYERTVKWFDENLEKTRSVAAKVAGSALSLNYEWYDENAVDLDSLSKSLAKRKDILAVVGPLNSSSVDVVAENLAENNKAILAPIASSADVVRKYSSKKNYRNLTETDITQSEILLAQAAAYGVKQVSLLTSKSSYGQTFIDWFAFQAMELGLKVNKMYVYDEGDETSLESMSTSAMNDSNECVIVAPSRVTDVKQVLKSHKAATDKPKLLFSDIALSPKVLDYDGAEGIEGTSMYADPESGFEISYEVAFGEVPIPGEAQIYDALMIVSLGTLEMMRGKTLNLNEAISHVVREDSGAVDVRAWTYEGMVRVMQYMLQDEHANISGASGDLDFDTENGTVVTKTVYCHWMVYDGKFLPLEFISSDGSTRTSATLSSWNMAASKMQDFDKTAKYSYPEHTKNYALLVAASTSWTNYRHQADVLSIYQMLKKMGYDDDHIVLIVADDLVQNDQNPNKGTVVNYNGDDVYKDVVVDYRLADLVAYDISAILNGDKSERLPYVIDADSNTNVAVFWSGHGGEGFLQWNDESRFGSFNYDRMGDVLSTLSRNKKYRKMIWFVEACYSASVCKAAEDNDIPGVMCLTASNANETSKTDVYNFEYKTYMTNRFTEILMGLLDAVQSEKSDGEKSDGEKADMTLRDLYYYLFKYTLGSHVTSVNDRNFDNLYQSGIREFLVPVNK